MFEFATMLIVNVGFKVLYLLFLVIENMGFGKGIALFVQDRDYLAYGIGQFLVGSNIKGYLVQSNDCIGIFRQFFIQKNSLVIGILRSGQKTPARERETRK